MRKWVYILHDLRIPVQKLNNMISLEIKAIVEDREDPLGTHTIYLFNKELRILLPIKINEISARQILFAKEDSFEPRPSVHDTTRRLVATLSGKIDRVIINGYSNDIFYSYIRVRQGNKYFDVDSKPTDAIALALRSKAPIFVDKRLADEVGIKVTPEMLSMY